MRGIVTYITASILVVVAMDFVAPPVGLGLMVGAKPVAVRPATIQFVDRTHKGDRLIVPTSASKQRTPEKPPVVLVGCDPEFSPLSASARADSPRRCVAELAHPLAG